MKTTSPSKCTIRFCILYHSYFSIFTDKVSSLKVSFAFLTRWLLKSVLQCYAILLLTHLGGRQLVKCAVASATPKPEFCIPTSIEIALLVPSSSLSMNAVIYPSKTESIMEHNGNKDKKA